VEERVKVSTFPGVWPAGRKNEGLNIPREKDKIRFSPCPGVWPAGKRILMSGELVPAVAASGKENTQRVRGVGLQEGEYSTCPGMRPAGRKILNLPADAACGKENTQHTRDCSPREGEYSTCPGIWPGGGEEYNGQEIVGADDLIN